MFNPTHIAADHIGDSPDAQRNTWQTAMTAMARKFEALCSKHNCAIVRYARARAQTCMLIEWSDLLACLHSVDAPFASGLGSSLFITPTETRLSTCPTPNYMIVYFDTRSGLLHTSVLVCVSDINCALTCRAWTAFHRQGSGLCAQHGRGQHRLSNHQHGSLLLLFRLRCVHSSLSDLATGCPANHGSVAESTVGAAGHRVRCLANRGADRAEQWRRGSLDG